MCHCPKSEAHMINALVSSCPFQGTPLTFSHQPAVESLGKVNIVVPFSTRQLTQDRDLKHISYLKGSYLRITQCSSAFVGESYSGTDLHSSEEAEEPMFACHPQHSLLPPVLPFILLIALLSLHLSFLFPSPPCYTSYDTV